MDAAEVYIEAQELAKRLRRDVRDLENGCAISPYYLADVCNALALLLEKQK